jgi:hypothetical protein
MKFRLPIIQLSPIIFFIFLSYISSAQAILTVNGARINMADSVYLSTNNLSLSNDGTLNVAASTLKVAGSITSTGGIDANNGTVEMNGTQAQQLLAGSFSGKFLKSLTINNTAGVTVNDTLKLTDVLTVAKGNLISGGFLTLKSYQTSTARIAPVTSLAAVPISGNVIVERFVSARRATRFLTAPVNSSGSIRENWMENTNNMSTAVNNNPVPNFGTHISGFGGSANGFDQTITNNPSLYTYNITTQAWVPAITTSTLFTAGTPYRITVRGSRSTNLNSNTSPPSVTTLRAKGSVVTGDIVLKAQGAAGGTPGMPVLSAANAAFSFVANPYASPVDWSRLDLTGISGTMYIFDGTINGANGRGAYVSFNRDIGDAGVSSNDTSKIDNNIQSGQALFVQTTGPNPSVAFKEIYKSGFHRAVFRSPNRSSQLSLHLLLSNGQTTGSSADALSAFFSEKFSSSVGNEDSYKLTNPDENIAILRNGKTLSIEGRKPITTADTLPLKMWQLTLKHYALKVAMKNFQDNTEGYLEDAFLHTSTRLSNDTSTILPFTITPDSLSFAPDRFRIVFKESVMLPLESAAIKAYVKNQGAEVEWSVVSESNIKNYIVEKSSDATHFAAVNLTDVRENTVAGKYETYEWFDKNLFKGDNYYRIKVIEKSGDAKYSKVVKVRLETIEGIISVILNGGTNNSLTMTFKDVAIGNYSLSMINNAGQKLYSSSIDHPGGYANYSIKLKNVLSKGIYHLQVSGHNKCKNIPVLIQ